MSQIPLVAAVVAGHISIFKSVLLLLILLGWARLLTWADKDGPRAHLQREWMNVMLMGSGLAGFALFFLMPGFFLGLVTLLVLILAGAGTYLGIRHNKVGLTDLQRDLADWWQNLFKKKKAAAKVEVGQVVLIKGNGTPLAPPDPQSPEHVAYEAVQTFLASALQKGAHRIDVRPAETGTAVAATIDGVSYHASTLDRAAAGAGITYLKRAAGLDINDRRKPQTGMLKATLDGRRMELEISTAGSTAGESLSVVPDPKKRFEKKLEDLGLLPAQLQVIQQGIRSGRGLVLVGTPPGQGLTTLMYSLLRGHDAFLTHIHSIERKPEADLEGITQNPLAPSAGGAEETKQVEWVISQQPDTILIDQVISPQAARELARYAAEKRVYVGMRAAGTFDALVQWMKLVGDEQLAARTLDLVLVGCVMRRLCTACKTAYSPNPEQLRKLNLDPQRVSRLYAARTQPIRDKKGNPVPCQFCHELRYKGRFGVYETLVVDDDVRAAMATALSQSQFMKLLRKQRGLLLQEVALVQVEAGNTSVQEVLRVLRGQ